MARKLAPQEVWSRLHITQTLRHRTQTEPLRVITIAWKRCLELLVFVGGRGGIASDTDPYPIRYHYVDVRGKTRRLPIVDCLRLVNQDLLRTEAGRRLGWMGCCSGRAEVRRYRRLRIRTGCRRWIQSRMRVPMTSAGSANSQTYQLAQSAGSCMIVPPVCLAGDRASTIPSFIAARDYVPYRKTFGHSHRCKVVAAIFPVATRARQIVPVA